MSKNKIEHMRQRETIEDTINWKLKKAWSHDTEVQCLMLEVLLDIRELLQNDNNNEDTPIPHTP